MLIVGMCVLTACQSLQAATPLLLEPAKRLETAESELHLLNRLTWGASISAVQQLTAMGRDRYVEQQLKPPTRATLAPSVQAQIDAMTISQRPLDHLVLGLEEQRRKAVAIKDNPEHRK